MTTPEFERKALAAMQQIRGSSKHRVEVSGTLVTAFCRIEPSDYEMSFSFATPDERERAFDFVLRGIETTRERFANG